MKNFYLSIILISSLLIINSSFAQNWTVYKELNGVKVSYSYQDCHNDKEAFHKQFVILKFENTTKQTLQVSWKINSWYNGKCSGCESDSPEFQRQISLEPGQTKQGDCEMNSTKLMRIFSKFLSYNDKTSELEKFELKDLKVSAIPSEGKK